MNRRLKEIVVIVGMVSGQEKKSCIKGFHIRRGIGKRSIISSDSNNHAAVEAIN